MKKNLYTADATATGGRSGHVRSSDSVIDMDMSVPEGLGGRKGATNPEQLFAAGYASCFQQALIVTAGRENLKLSADSTVQCSVTLFQDGESYGLSAVLDIDLKDMEPQQATDLVNKAHQICPYSVGTRGNMEVELKIAGQPATVPTENA